MRALAQRGVLYFWPFSAMSRESCEDEGVVGSGVGDGGGWWWDERVVVVEVDSSATASVVVVEETGWGGGAS